MFCSKCGIRLDEGNRFCQACGQEVGAPIIAAPSAAGVLFPVPVGGSTHPVPPLPYGAFWARLVAYVIDGLIIGVPSMIALFTAMFFFGGFGMLLHHSTPIRMRSGRSCLPCFQFSVWAYSSSWHCNGSILRDWKVPRVRQLLASP